MVARKRQKTLAGRIYTTSVTFPLISHLYLPVACVYCRRSHMTCDDGKHIVNAYRPYVPSRSSNANALFSPRTIAYPVLNSIQADLANVVSSAVSAISAMTSPKFHHRRIRKALAAIPRIYRFRRFRQIVSTAENFSYSKSKNRLVCACHLTSDKSSN